jgi:hypothetical protein
MYARHYSARRLPGRTQCLGPGETIALRTAECDAIFAWRKFIDDSGQRGVCCAVFRNEGPTLSSILIRQADAIADHVWPGQRHYTFVDPSGVRSANPGACFRHAGWRRCGETKGGLIVLERWPQ